MKIVNLLVPMVKLIQLHYQTKLVMESKAAMLEDARPLGELRGCCHTVMTK